MSRHVAQVAVEANTHASAANKCTCLSGHTYPAPTPCRCYTFNDYVYYTYGLPPLQPEGCCGEGRQCSNQRAPILFLHGVGLGLLPYVPFLSRLVATGHPIVAVEFRCAPSINTMSCFM